MNKQNRKYDIENPQLRIPADLHAELVNLCKITGGVLNHTKLAEVLIRKELAEVRSAGGVLEYLVQNKKTNPIKMIEKQLQFDTPIPPENKDEITLTPENIKNRRQALGMTKRQLAGFLAIHEDVVSQWESGARTPLEQQIPLLRVILR